MITAIAPGSYDPVTNGHVDVITRAAGIFDRVVVGVVGTPQHKEPMFAVEERVEFLRGALAGLGNVEIDVFRELVVDFARRWDAKAIVKGLRVISDFEWEFQMNQLNRHPRAGGGDGLRDGEPAGELRLLERCEGDRGVRRRRLGARAGTRGAPARRTLPGRSPRDARAAGRVTESHPPDMSLESHDPVPGTGTWLERAVSVRRRRTLAARTVRGQAQCDDTSRCLAPGRVRSRRATRDATWGPAGFESRVLRPEGYTAEPMDVLVLIDKLDDLVHNAKAVPLTDQVRIDREEIYDILDQMRATIPEEIKQARWIVKERQEMLAEAKREVDRLLAEAREQAVREASQTEIVKIAERQADEIVDDARRGAREMKLEMEDWADNQLASLEVNLERFLTAVRRGRERLHERSQESVVAGLASNGDLADDERF